MKDLINNTLQLINNKESRSLLKEYVEIAIDASTGSEILKSIPMVNTLTGGGKFIISVRDQLFLKKMKTFLEGLEDIPQEKIDEFIEEIKEKNEKEELGEKIISVVEQADSKDKSRLLGILFRMYLKQDISRSDFEFLSFCVNKAFMEDIYRLTPRSIKDKNSIEVDEIWGSALYPLGLANMEIEERADPFHTDDSSRNRIHSYFSLNDYGKILTSAVRELDKLEG